MALLYMLLGVALTWSLGALQLWPRMRRVRELPLWLGGALAVGVAACVAWGFVGVLRIGDWQSLSMDQAVNRVFGTGSLWFQRSGWGRLDRVANVYALLDIAFTLLALSAASMHGYVFWVGMAERRRRARIHQRR